MPILAVAPLTFGQLSLWRSIQELTAERLSVANLQRSWALPEGCSSADLESAMSLLVKRHEALRTRFRRSGPRGIEQEVWAAEPVRLKIVEAGDDAERTAAKVARGLTEQPFDLAAEFLWRAVAVGRNGEPLYLCLSIHHMAADRVSLGLLYDDLCTLLAGGSFDGAAATPRAVAETQASEAWAPRRAAAVEHWRKALEAAPPPLPPAGPNAAMFSGSFRSTTALDATRTCADRLGVSMHSVLLAVLCDTLAEQTGENQLLIGMMAGNRNDAASRTLVASQNQLVPYLVKRDTHDPFDTFTRQVHWETLLAYRHGSFDVDDVEPLAKRYGRYGNGDGFDYIFNFAQGPTVPDGTTRGEGEIQVRSAGRDIGYPLYFQAGKSADALWCQLSLRKETEETGFESEVRYLQETRAFLDAFLLKLRGQASGQPV
ncbi:condensation domain-containing protein [Streptomyces cellostaticus]|uniref:condensation domain-containing protein n=1 Tax=Streptomyces cellostaticus TaxID=67285 RepID=UPI00202657ED|nr:condensation domain-containing protein [Streptomyces cellostaticus]